jgi:hypothetical protein
MRKTLFLGLALIVMPLFGQWKQDGKAIRDEPWRKSSGTFGAMLLLTDHPYEFVEEWKRPELPTIHTTTVAERGRPIAAFVIFLGCKEISGNCKSTVDFTILRPDGTEYGKQDGLELWSGPTPAENVIQLGRASMGVEIEPNDPAGKYVMKARVHDLNASATIDLVQEFTVAPAAKVTEIAGLAALQQWIDGYYYAPHPDLVLSAIRYMERAGFPATDDQANPLIGFFSEVFASNPMLAQQWKAAAAEASGRTRQVLDTSFRNAQNLATLTSFDPQKADPGQNDVCWGAYFASGKDVYVLALVQRLAYLSERKSLQLYLTAASAQWSLSSNLRQHVSVRRILDGARLKASPEVRAAIEEAVEKDPGAIQESTTNTIRAQHEAKVW